METMEPIRSLGELTLPTLEAGPLHSFLAGCFDLHLENKLQPQIYVLTGLLGLIAAYSLAYVLRKAMNRGLWILRVQLKDGRRIFIVNIAFWIQVNGGAFAILFLSQVWSTYVIGKGYRKTNSQMDFMWYSPLISFVTLAGTAWGCLAGVVHATPGILSDTDFIWKSNRRSRVSAPVLNFFFFAPPVLTVALFAGLSIKMGKVLSKSYSLWLALEPRLLALDPSASVSDSLALDSLVMWQTWTEGIRWFSWGMGVWAVVGALLLVLGVIVFALSTRVIRRHINEHLTSQSDRGNISVNTHRTHFYPPIVLPTGITFIYQHSGASAEALSRATSYIAATLFTIILSVIGLITLAGLMLGGCPPRATQDPYGMWTFSSRIMVSSLWLTTTLGSVIIYVVCSDPIQPLLEGYGKRTTRVNDSYDGYSSTSKLAEGKSRSGRSLSTSSRQKMIEDSVIHEEVELNGVPMKRSAHPIGPDDVGATYTYSLPDETEDEEESSATPSRRSRWPSTSNRAADASSRKDSLAGEPIRSTSIQSQGRSKSRTRPAERENFSQPDSDRPWYFVSPTYRVEREMQVSYETNEAPEGLYPHLSGVTRGEDDPTE